MHQDKPSKTAFGVASVLLALSEDRTHPGLVSRPYADQLARLMAATGTTSRFGIALVRTRAMAAFYRWMFNRMIPGQYAAVGRRKQFFEARARDAIAAGARQVLVLGAGYDLVCYRLAPDHAEVRFFETDHPATAQVKAPALQAIGAAANIVPLPLDLTRTTLRDVLLRAGWDPTAMSIVLAEGLTQYLPENAVRDLLDEVAVMTGPGSRFALTFVGWRDAEDRPEAGPNTDKMLKRLERSGEPWFWGCDPSRLGGFLQDTDWRITLPPEPAGMDNLVELAKVADGT